MKTQGRSQARNKELLKAALALAFVGAVMLWVLFVTGCGYAKHSDPQLYTYDSAAVTAKSARLHAASVLGGYVLLDTCCGSMKPLIQTGDLLVVQRTPFDLSNLLGRVLVYFPDWNGKQAVAHRTVAVYASGYIMSGDNNPRSEPEWRLNAQNYGGEVVAIYRTVGAP